MKLQNKKTGQIGNFIINKDHFECVDLDYVPEYRNLAELNEEWEDYEEPKVAYWIDSQGDICEFTNTEVDDWTKEKQIGNYFETKEEAEKAVEKLKAWKRLKDKGFRFKGLDRFGNIRFEVDDKYESTYLNVYPFRKFEKDEVEFLKDLDICFGGEE